MTEKIQYIPARLKNAAKDGHVAGVEDIIDDLSGKTQQEINSNVDAHLEHQDNKIDALEKQDIVLVAALPSVADADPKKIYRVAGTDSYTDYMLNAAGTDFDKLATYTFPGIDDEPTAGSDNPVKSGGVQKELALGSVYDVSAKNSTAGPNNDGKFTLEYILNQNNVNTLIPTAVRKGGMSVKFIQSSDNNYVSYRYMLEYANTTAGNAAFVNTANWQGVDDKPVAGSNNLVKSGGVFDGLYPKLQITLTIGYRINNSGNYVSSNNNYESSDVYIPTENAKTLIGKFSLDINNNIAFYDINKALISCYQVPTITEHIVNIPVNTVYMRVSNRHDRISNPEFRLTDKQVGKIVGFYTSGNFTKVDENGNVVDSEYSISDFNLYKTVPIKGNINLLCPNGIENKWLLNTGEIRNYEGFFLLDYIKVKPSTDYYMSTGNNAIIGSGASGICFYDKDLQFISGITITKQFTTPVGCEYIRCNTTIAYINDLASSQLQLSEGTTKLQYVPYNPVEKYVEDYNNRQNYNGKITNLANFVGTATAGKVDNAYGTNLFDKNSPNIIKGKWLVSSDGSFRDNASCGISDYIPVTAGEKYTLTRDLSNGPIPNPTTISGGGTGLCFYDAQKNFISGSNLTSRTYTMPDGTFYLRTSFNLANIDNICVNKGEERAFYEPCSAIKGHNAYLENAIYETSPAASMCGRNSHAVNIGTLSNGILEDTDFPGYVKSSSVVSVYGKITQFSEVLVGIGGNVTHPVERYIKVDTNNVYFCRKVEGNSEIVLATYAHGLTIDTFVGIVFITKDTKSKVIISTLGGYYEKEEDYSNYASTYGSNVIECYGHPFVKADSNTQLNEVSLSSNCPRFKDSIWVVGDSYVSLSSFRWTWQLRQIQDIEFNIIGLAGAKSPVMINDFYKCLNYGTPKYLIWALGMNDNPDANEDTPDTTWLNIVNYVIKYCNIYGITPILATIPNVPTRSHVGKNKWVRESGYRYIDFCEAVGATAEGTWYEGCLDQDGVHPTVVGAKALAAGVLKDFSEITM